MTVVLVQAISCLFPAACLLASVVLEIESPGKMKAIFVRA
jgi:hypothetical protein